MERKNDPFQSYAYLDSQRLKDTFFSPPKKRKKKKLQTGKKILLIPAFAFLAVIALTGVILLATKYEFMVVDRKDFKPERTGLSLLNSDNLSELAFLGKEKQSMRKGSSFIYLTVSPQEKNGITLDFKKPLDLNANNLFLCLKRPQIPLTIEVIARDKRFYSNSLSPLLIEIQNTKDTPYLIVPVDLKGSNIQNTNLAEIQQLKICFSHKDRNNINRVLIKNVILAKKGG